MYISSREFNHDLSYAKKMSLQSPVVITNRGEPEHVLLSYTDYVALLKTQCTPAQLLASDDDLTDDEFERYVTKADGFKAAEFD